MSWKPLYMCCPTKGCKNTSMSTWVHTSCGYSMNINERADLQCSYHRNPKNIFYWRFDCGSHGHKGEESFRYPDYSKLLAVLACSYLYSDKYDDDIWLANLVLYIHSTKPN